MPGYVLIAVMERASIRAQVLDPAGEASRVFEAPIASIKGSLKASAGALLEEMERAGRRSLRRMVAAVCLPEWRPAAISTRAAAFMMGHQAHVRFH